MYEPVVSFAPEEGPLALDVTFEDVFAAACITQKRAVVLDRERVRESRIDPVDNQPVYVLDRYASPRREPDQALHAWRRPGVRRLPHGNPHKKRFALS